MLRNRLTPLRSNDLYRHGTELEWPMVTIWPRRDMNELSFLQYVNSVPFTFRYDARFARLQFNGSVRFGLSRDLDASRNYVEYLVSIRMDLTSVRCVILDRDDADGHAIDSGRRTRPMGSGGHREVTMNVEQVARNIDWGNSVYQAILLSKMMHAICPMVELTGRGACTQPKRIPGPPPITEDDRKTRDSRRRP